MKYIGYEKWTVHNDRIVSSVVELSLRTQEVPGSNPGRGYNEISFNFFFKLETKNIQVPIM